MLDIAIIAVGSIKEANIAELVDEYLKRLKPFARIKVVEVKPEPFYSDDQKTKARAEEAERLRRALMPYEAGTIYVLDESGKEFTSLGFAKELGALQGPICFVIGGALGWSDEMRAMPYKKLSLSQMTMPHELARLVLIEQIYRATTIINGKNYHY